LEECAPSIFKVEKKMEKGKWWFRYREGRSGPWPWANQWKMRDTEEWEGGRESLVCHWLQFMSDV
jgi:hypothetical protein